MEALLAGITGTKSLAALALFDDEDRAGEVLPRLNKESKASADTFRAVNEGSHEALRGDILDVVRNTEKLSRWMQIARMTPTDLLAAAQRLLDRPDARTAGIWPRAAAILARQALEQGLDAYWRSKGLRLDALATKPQLICLGAYLTDGGIAGRASHAWAALTHACHHHPYEVHASPAELSSWIDTVAEVLHATDRADKGQLERV